MPFRSLSCGSDDVSSQLHTLSLRSRLLVRAHRNFNLKARSRLLGSYEEALRVKSHVLVGHSPLYQLWVGWLLDITDSSFGHWISHQWSVSCAFTGMSGFHRIRDCYADPRRSRRLASYSSIFPTSQATVLMRLCKHGKSARLLLQNDTQNSARI